MSWGAFLWVSLGIVPPVLFKSSLVFVSRLCPSRMKFCHQRFRVGVYPCVKPIRRAGRDVHRYAARAAAYIRNDATIICAQVAGFVSCLGRSFLGREGLKGAIVNTLCLKHLGHRNPAITANARSRSDFF